MADEIAAMQGSGKREETTEVKSEFNTGRFSGAAAATSDFRGNIKISNLLKKSTEKARERER